MSPCLRGGVCLTASAQTEVLIFDDPALIDLDFQTFVATYPVGGFRITGSILPNLPYLPFDDIGKDGTGGLLVYANSLITLMSQGGDLFNLRGLDSAASDLIDPINPPGNLTISGMVSGGGLLELTLSLVDVDFKSFSIQGWTNLTQVSFVADSAFVVDNINAVIPEPASLARVSVALAGLTLVQRRKHDSV